MRYLLDTGILIRLPHRTDPLHPVVRESLRRLAEDGHEFVTTTQNIAEFWNVCTRPNEARGGFGLTVEQARDRLRLLERFITILREPPSAYEKWKRLVVAQSVLGKQVHDARIAAVMGAYRIRHILTLNPSDFSRYKSVVADTPQMIIAT